MVEDFSKYLSIKEREFEKSLRLSKMLKSLDGLTTEFKRYVIQKNTPLQDAYWLSKFTGLEQDALYMFIKEMNVSQSKLKEIVIILKEMSLRDEISIDRMLGRDELKSLLLNTELSRTQRCDKFRLVLKQLRYPKTLGLRL